MIISYSLPRDRFIHPIRLAHNQELISTVEVVNCLDDSLNYIQAAKAFEEVIKEYREWVKPVLDLNDYPFVYPTNGVTHGIDQWLINETQDIQSFVGEYGWVKSQRPNISEIEDPKYMDITKVFYMSNPFSATGNFDPRWEAVIDFGCPVILDAAFVGTTFVKEIPLNKNVEIVMLSLSKPFGLGVLRIGFMFSRNPIKSLEELKQAAYFNALIVPITRLMIRNNEIDTLKKHLVESQNEICSKIGLEASDCCLTGITKSPRFRFYARENGVNRLSLSPLYKQHGVEGLA